VRASSRRADAAHNGTNTLPPNGTRGDGFSHSGREDFAATRYPTTSHSFLRGCSTLHRVIARDDAQASFRWTNASSFAFPHGCSQWRPSHRLRQSVQVPGWARPMSSSASPRRLTARSPTSDAQQRRKITTRVPALAWPSHMATSTPTKSPGADSLMINPALWSGLRS